MSRERPGSSTGSSPELRTSARIDLKRGRRRGEMTGARAVWQRFLSRQWVWAAILVVIGSLLLMPREQGLMAPPLEVGDIAARDWLASRDVLVLDVEATDRARETARQNVLPIYDFDSTLSGQLDEQWARLFAAGRRYVEERDAIPDDIEEADADSLNLGDEDGTVEPSGRDRLAGSTSLELSDEALDLLINRRFVLELEDRVRGLYGSLLRIGVVDDKRSLLENRLHGITLRDRQSEGERVRLDLYGYVGAGEEASNWLKGEMRRWSGFPAAERAVLERLLLANLQPNVYLNRTETAARRDQAAESAEQVFKQIREGQVLVRKGDEVDVATVAAIEELGGNRPRFAWVASLVGNLLLLLGLVGLLHLGISFERSRRRVGASTFGGLVLLLIGAMVSVTIATVIAQALGAAFETAPFDDQLSYLFGIPFAALALMVSLFYGRGLALVTAIGFSLVAGRMVGADAWWPTCFMLIGSLAAIFSLDRLKERSAVTRAGLMVGLANIGAIGMLQALDPPEEVTVAGVAFAALCGFIGGILVAAVASFLLPILENVLAVTTDIRLVELSDTNLPLLRRLAFEAPGTFQHSLMVANLAKVGCDEISANSALAYTAGLYHDIGKMLRAQYFVENQGRENPHDKLTPSMSSLIVINHVKEGADLAQEYRLPEPIIDAVREHHGTRKLNFFYKRALEQQGDDGGGVVESDFRYPGPKPQSREMGVLMFADGVEAASRVLRDPNPARIKALIDEILEDCLADHQFDDCDLTLHDLARVKAGFCRVLESIYHKRVEYPGFDFNKQRDRFRAV